MQPTPTSNILHSTIFEQSIVIAAPSEAVEALFTNLDQMTQWLNPALSCEPLEGPWRTEVGAKSCFVVRPLTTVSQFFSGSPLALQNIVIERAPGLVVWQFEGFFCGTDRWECQPHPEGTQLLNRFTFTIPNPLVRTGFQLFAARWTAQDMQAQLQRIKAIAEKSQH